MSFGHSNVTHYKRPPNAEPTDSVEEFMRQCIEAGTVEIIQCAKEYKPIPKRKARNNMPEGQGWDESGSVEHMFGWTKAFGRQSVANVLDDPEEL